MSQKVWERVVALLFCLLIVVAVYVIIRTPIPEEVKEEYTSKVIPAPTPQKPSFKPVRKHPETLSTSPPLFPSTPKNEPSSKLPYPETKPIQERGGYAGVISNMTIIQMMEDLRLDFLRWRQASNGGQNLRRGKPYQVVCQQKRQEVLEHVRKNPQEAGTLINLFLSEPIPEVYTYEAGLIQKLNPSSNVDKLMQGLQGKTSVDKKKAILEAMGSTLSPESLQRLQWVAAREKTDEERLIFQRYLNHVTLTNEKK